MSRRPADAPAPDRTGLSDAAQAQLDRLTELLVMTLLVVGPLQVERILTRAPGKDDSHHRVSLFLFDAPALGLVVIALISTNWWSARLTRDERLLRWGVGLWLLATALSAAAHPSFRSGQAVLRLIEIIAIGIGVHRVCRLKPRKMTIAAGCAGVAQGELSLLQVLHKDALGLFFLGETGPLQMLGASVAPKGTFTHRYLLAGFALVICFALIAVLARGGSKWLLLGLGICALPIGLTLGRMALLGALLGLLCLSAAVLRGWRTRLSAAVLLLSIALGMMLNFSGWVYKKEFSAEVDRGPSGRIALGHQALDLSLRNPVLGVGPGLYSIALAPRLGLAPGDPTEVLPVHNVPLLVLAETGPAGLAGILLALVALARRAVRSGPHAAGLFACYLPFLLVDVPYALPMGIPIMGAWGGVVWFVSRPAAGPDVNNGTVRAVG